MAKRTVEESSLAMVADSIRERAGTSEPLVFPNGFMSAVDDLVSNRYVSELVQKTATELKNEYIITIYNGFQSDNKNLAILVLSSCETIGEASFRGCSSLVTINTPNLVTLKGDAFRECSALTELHFPSLTTMDSYGYEFMSCTNLQKADFPVLQNINAGSFLECRNLKTLILRTGSVVTLANTGAFGTTPIQWGTGYVYVPKSLVDSYKSATNWSTFANQIRAIEDYPEVLEGWE